jgi:tetratricopeptide (TPR) repeat protein
MRRGRVREAQVHLDRQLATARQTGDRVAECGALLGFARLDVARGRLDAAGQTLAAARRLAEESARRTDGAAVYAELARLCLLRGDAAGLLQHATRALSKAQLARDRDLEVEALTLAGRAAEERGEADEAVDWFEQAIGREDGSGAVEAALVARLGLARLARRGGRHEAAGALLREVASRGRAADLRGPQLLAQAMQAAMGDLPCACVRAELVRHGDRLTLHERLEVFLELATASGDLLFQQEARDIVADLAHDLVDVTLEDMVAGCALYRRALGPLDAARVLGARVA